jgi:hypothetical protein
MPYQSLEEPFGEDWEAVRRNFRSLRKDMNPPVPQARVYNNANISAPTSGTFTLLAFNSERYDNGGLHSTSANTSRLTAPITGLYSGAVGVTFASNATGRREVVIQLNATTNIAYDSIPAVSGAQTRMTVPFEYQLAAGDFLEVYVLQTSGGALNVEVQANYSPEFWMHRVAGYVNQGV